MLVYPIPESLSSPCFIPLTMFAAVCPFSPNRFRRLHQQPLQSAVRNEWQDKHAARPHRPPNFHAAQRTNLSHRNPAELAAPNDQLPQQAALIALVKNAVARLSG